MKWEEQEQEPRPSPFYHIDSNHFIGVQWDKASLQTVQTVAEALLNLTTLFKSQNVTIEALLNVGECKNHADINRRAPEAEQAHQGEPSSN